MTNLIPSNRFLLTISTIIVAVALATPTLVKAQSHGSIDFTPIPYENTMPYLLDQAKSLYDRSQGNSRSTAAISEKINALHGKIEISMQPTCDNWSVNGGSGACVSGGGAPYSAPGQDRPSIAEIVSDMNDIRNLLVDHNGGSYCYVPTASNWTSVKPGLACLHKILNGEQENASPYGFGSSAARNNIEDVRNLLRAVEARVGHMQMFGSNGGSGVVAPSSGPVPVTTDPVPFREVSGGDGGPSSISRSVNVTEIRNLLELVLKRIEELLSTGSQTFDLTN